jgi:hypothetical protein
VVDVGYPVDQQRQSVHGITCLRLLGLLGLLGLPGLLGLLGSVHLVHLNAINASKTVRKTQVNSKTVSKTVRKTQVKRYVNASKQIHASKTQGWTAYAGTLDGTRFGRPISNRDPP